MTTKWTPEMGAAYAALVPSTTAEQLNNLAEAGYLDPLPVSGDQLTLIRWDQR